jgi:hypothetical protein
MIQAYKGLFFKVFIPLIWLIPFAFVISGSAVELLKAWKKNNFKLIWFYTWIISFSLYFLNHRG